MIIDYRSSDVPSDLDGDICVIGTGPAGITLALDLAAAGRRVLLLEGGGENVEPDTQQLYDGEILGRPYDPLTATRLRVLGGSSVHWSGMCGSLTELDFQAREWIPLSGWPFSKTELDPFYEKAQLRFGPALGPPEYEADYWAHEYSAYPEFAADKFAPRVWQFSRPPKRFWHAHAGEFASTDVISVYTHANVTRVNLDPAGARVSSVEIRTLSGKTGVALARTFVLACGGIENPRLLLASNDVNPQGVGNDRDVVGRYFMEHPRVVCGKIFDFNLRQMDELSALWTRDCVRLKLALCPSANVQRKLKMTNVAGRVDDLVVNERNGWESFNALRRGIAAGRMPKQAMKDLGLWLRDFDTFAAFLSFRLRGRSTDGRTIRDGSVQVECVTEQVPNPASRIRLSERLDAFGNPLAALDWQLTDLERHSIRHTMILIAAEVNRLELGRLQLEEWLRNGSDWPSEVDGGPHHMGATRMSNDPATGVVDENCRVHGVANLYVAGSSVFPTGGYNNPTLTIVAMAIRLAEHLSVSATS